MREWQIGRRKSSGTLKTLIVGDIHGCIDELLDLVEAAQLRESDRLISLGDILNKGPAPEEVFEYLSRRPNTLILMGNHEVQHLQKADGADDEALATRIARAQFSPSGYEGLIAAANNFPLYEELDEALLLHGYFEAGVPPDEQKPEVLVGRDRGKNRLVERGLWPWYDHYDYPKPVIVGHKAYRSDWGPFVIPGRVYAIDTKCCEGGSLTGLLLPGFEIISVRARRDHWRVIQMAWGSFDPERDGRFTLPRLRPGPPIATAAQSPTAAAGHEAHRIPHRPWLPFGWAWRFLRGRF